MYTEEKIRTESLQEEHSPGELHRADQSPPPGRPWVKGQSGNPRGRPSRAHKAAYVAHAMFDDKTTQLVDRAIGWGQGGDKSMLRLYLQRLVPPRPEVPVWLNLPPIEDRDGLRAAMKAVATGVAQGDITSAQGLRLVRLFTEIYRYL
jgi:hypothetical protein